MNWTRTTRTRQIFLLLLLGPVLVTWFAPLKVAADDREDALRTIRQTILKASRFIRRKENEEATKLLNEANDNLQKWKTQFNVSEKDRTYQSVLELIQQKQASLGESTGEPDEKKPTRTNRNSKVSFSRHVMPILQENCFSCHDDQKAGGLQLDTLEGMRQGGKGGRILEPKNARTSLIMQRLIATGNGRMPKDADPLSRDELIILNDWIVQGAEIDEFKVAEKKPNSTPEKIEVPRPTGKETVSFKRDIAPFFARLCLGCHNDQQKRADFSMASFQKLLEGGESGEVLIPGDLENSRLFRLTGGLELPRMPNNDARLTRKNYEDLKKWIEEGIKYDGGNPNESLTSLLPTEQDLARQQFDSMPEEEFRKHRLDESTQLWKRVGSGKDPNLVETDHFLLLGNVPEERLRAAGSWAEETYSYLQTRYGEGEKPAWKGRLAIFITDDRFLHGEFFTYLKKGKPEDIPAGLVQVTPANATAYVELFDTGNQATSTTPGLPFQLRQLVTEAYLIRGGVKIPDWFRSGMAQRIVLDETNWDFQKSPWMRGTGGRLLGSIEQVSARRQKPGDLYTDNFFTPAEVDLYGLALVREIAKGMDQKSLDLVIAAVRNGAELNKALVDAGAPEPNGVERAFVLRLQKVKR
ncbi:MAG: hypothetical protein KDA65_13335 [Planctomycetaceae bacterium]|nr:hypothetical protein [Planctomycetaceae bacterium]